LYVGPELPEALPGIDIASALKRLEGNRKLYWSILSEFHRDFSSTAQKISKAISGKGEVDLKAAGELAHAVKGLAGNISAPELFDTALALENGLRDGQRETWPKLLEVFRKAQEQVVESIDTLLMKENTVALENKDEPTEASPVDLDKVVPLLNKLAGYLRKTNSRAQGTFEILKPILAGSTKVGLEEELLHMEEHIERYDFKKAYASLERLAKVLEVVLEEDET
jgi:two-component system, sensor histidine kinase and response regulator